MRILNREEFLKLPSNTLFSKYEPCIFGELCIKGDTWTSDFLVQDISDAIESNDSGEFIDKLEDAEKNGTKLTMDFDCMGRDGCFEKDQLFAVWDKEDVEALINRLKDCL